MRKILVISLITLLSAVLTCGFAYAAITGPCSDCHTMHNSQDGLNQAKDFTGTLTGTAYGNLTKSSCLGCHNGVLGGSVTAPNVFANNYDIGLTSNIAAGGSFAGSWTNPTVAQTTDAMVHNVTDLSSLMPYGQEGTLTAPPGDNASTGITNLNFTCAGFNGCHGDRTNGSLTSSDEGIKGFHHQSKGKGSYRFLQLKTSATNIKGSGSSDWEQITGGPTDSDHNIYSADTTAGISKFCGTCHGTFHDSIGTAGAWIRHPTDNLLSATGWNLNSINVSGGTHYTNYPFAFQDGDMPTTGQAYNANTTGARVACVSCHRAHGTPYSDILRWDYSEQLAGEGSSSSIGCLGCHYLQR